MRQFLLVSKNKNLEGNYVKKISLILALTLVLVSAFAAVAFADPSQPNNAGTSASLVSDGTDGSVYLPGGDIHSNYTANTDACSACHAVHTGNSEALLQWAEKGGGVSDICMSCHDGTVTATYDVMNGHVANTGALSSAGLFAESKNGVGVASSSQHAVFNNLEVAAAFGGGVTADKNGQWTGEFSCVACHTPHGQGGNVRILDPNPNWIQTLGVDPSTVKGVNGAAVTSTDGGATFSFSTVAVVAGSTTDARGNVISALPAGKPILGRPYGIDVFVGGVKQTQGSNDPKVNNAYASAKCFVTFDTTTKIPYVKFYAAPAGAVTINYTPALQSGIQVANKLSATETVSYTGDPIKGGINNWCGACHTDYNTATDRQVAPWNNLVDTSTGDYTYTDSKGATFVAKQGTANQYSIKTRHGVGAEGVKNNILQPSEGATPTKNGVLMCLTCHFAHGVDESRWADLGDKSGVTAYGSITNGTTSPEIGGSSKLKRLPNMGVCEVCHQKEVGAYSAGNQISW
jgi:predicted CXXCH cytochrome family protein